MKQLGLRKIFTFRKAILARERFKGTIPPTGECNFSRKVILQKKEFQQVKKKKNAKEKIPSVEKLIQKHHRKNYNKILTIKKNAMTFRKKNFDNKKKRIYIS